MAAIARKLVPLLLILCSAAWTDQSADIHAAIGAMADALSDGDSALAIASLSKSGADYQKLSDDFNALAQAYAIHNSIGFVDEDLTDKSATITVQWDMNLTRVQGYLSNNRSSQLVIKLALDNKNWRVREISPNKFFDP